MRSARDSFLNQEEDQEESDHPMIEEEEEEETVDESKSEGQSDGVIITPGVQRTQSTSTDTATSHSSLTAASAHPSPTSLHPLEALRLTQSSASLLILNLPRGTQFGIDLWSFVVGQKFAGMKMIPPGVHFIWTGGRTVQGMNAASTSHSQMMGDPDMVPRVGCWLWLSASEVCVREWKDDLESLVSMEDADEEARYIAGAKRFDFDAGQGTYPIHEHNRWTYLTSFMTKELVERLEPIDKMIGAFGVKKYSIQDKQPQPTSSSTMSNNFEQNSIETGEQKTGEDAGMEDVASNALGPSEPTTKPAQRKSSAITSKASTSFYTRIPTVALFIERHYASTDPELRPTLVTQLHMDQTPIFEHVLNQLTTAFTSTTTSSDESTTKDVALSPVEHALLGEYQFAFLSFFIGQDYEGFEQWKRLTTLFCSCADALTSHHSFYEAWISVLAGQLNFVPKDFFVDLLSGDNFLQPCLTKLFQHSSDALIPTSFIYTLKELQGLLQKKFMWKLKQLPTFQYQDEIEREKANQSTNTNITATDPHQPITVRRSGVPTPAELAAFKRQLQSEADEDEYAPTIVDEETTINGPA